MLAILFFLSTQDVVEQDRRQFETFWAEQVKKAENPLPSKKMAWLWYEWTQAQFSLGYCSQYLRADEAENMRTIPNEEEMMRTEIGRQFLTGSRKAFQDGMAFRREVRPSCALCVAELKGRVAALDAAARSNP